MFGRKYGDWLFRIRSEIFFGGLFAIPYQQKQIWFVGKLFWKTHVTIVNKLHKISFMLFGYVLGFLLFGIQSLAATFIQHPLQLIW